MTDGDAARLGRMLAAARADHGLSTPVLARQVGTAQSTIVRLELGRFATPTPALLQRLATALDLPLSELYALAGVPLPKLQPYLRSSYGLTDADARRAQMYIERLAAGYATKEPDTNAAVDDQPDLELFQ